LERRNPAGSIDIAEPAMPGGKLSMPIEASLKADVGNERIELVTKTTVEGSTIDARTNVSGFEKPKIAFDLKADKLDLDRIAPPVATPPAAEKPAGSPGGAAPAAPAGQVDLS